MPDPARQTVSATQSPALFNVSPYYTRWMLWQHFANGIEIDSPPDARMVWGKKLQPLILEQAAQDLRLEVRPNAGDEYHRRGQLGCTRDATIVCPDRGPGALETKCVFDYRAWMTDWQGGKTPPRCHEIQLQQQMQVGDESGTYRWGILVAWVAGELHFFEREPIAELWAKLDEEAESFFAEVRDAKEPDPFGSPLEIPLLSKLFPTKPGNVIDMSADPAAAKHSEMVSLYKHYKAEETSAGRAAEPLRAEILALARDAEEIFLPFGVNIRVSTSKNSVKRITVYVPDDVHERRLATPIPNDILMAG